MSKIRMILLGILPIVLLSGIIGFIVNYGTGVNNNAVVPIEVLNIQKISLDDETGFDLEVLNSGPNEVTIVQVLVNDAFANAEFVPDDTLSRFETGTVHIPYMWVQGDPYEIKLITSNGLIFTGEVAVAANTPKASPELFGQYALIGFYVGIVPIGLGLLWFPFLRRFRMKGMHAILALTVGLLFFLVVDTIEEGLEIAANAPEVFQGTGLVWFGALLSFLFLVAIDQSGGNQLTRDAVRGKRLSYQIATGIGLHNFGEGLAIGASFAIGEAALGAFLIIGFTLHNITEGVGIAAPLLKEQPTLRTFALLAVIAGAPAIIGTWTGGFIFNDTWAALFFGIGAGAIAQVIVAVSRLIYKQSVEKGLSPVSWMNFGGLTLGIMLMYVTALMVKF